MKLRSRFNAGVDGLIAACLLLDSFSSGGASSVSASNHFHRPTRCMKVRK
jgi:hypothetical protein